MGLSIYLLASCNERESRRLVARINQRLEEHHLPLHNEPQTLLTDEIDLPTIEWLYSTSECLEFLAAKFVENPSWIPPANRKDYQVISATSHHNILQQSQSHIVCLPKDSGYYVPIYFNPPLLNQCPRLGSSFVFQNELKALARKLNFDLGEYSPNLEVLLAKREEEFNKDLFGREKKIILCLYNLASASIYYGSAIVFSG